MPFLGWLSDPFEWLSDLQLGDEKVTLNHLGLICLLLVVNIISLTAGAGTVCQMSMSLQRRAEVSHGGQLFATGQQGDNADVILWSPLAWHGHGDTPRKINGWNMSSWRFGSDHFPF